MEINLERNGFFDFNISHGTVILDLPVPAFDSDCNVLTVDYLFSNSLKVATIINKTANYNKALKSLMFKFNFKF